MLQQVFFQGATYKTTLGDRPPEVKQGLTAQALAKKPKRKRTDGELSILGYAAPSNPALFPIDRVAVSVVGADYGDQASAETEKPDPQESSGFAVIPLFDARGAEPQGNHRQ
jgi:hypothetical protein